MLSGNDCVCDFHEQERPVWIEVWTGHGGREARLKAEARWRAEEEARQPFLTECALMARSLPYWKYLEWWREQKALGREGESW